MQVGHGHRQQSREVLGIELAWLRARVLAGVRRACLRAPILALVALLQVALFWALGRQMRLHQPPSKDPVQPIVVEFILPPPSAGVPAPLPELVPLRRRPTAVSRPPEPRRSLLPPPVATSEPTSEPPRLRLFRPDGSVNIDEQTMRDIDRRVLADGVAEYRIADLDAAGYFVSRPALEYKETVFERFWIPNESLLEEWVRRGIKEVRIPIPGTTKHLTCVISLVAPGGGCFGPFDAPQLARHEEPVYDPPPNRNLLTE